MDQSEFKYYVSETLNALWGMGKTQIMDCTFETAAYVARYVTKKLTGPRAVEYGDKLPERPVCVSRRPGIGKGYFDLYKHHIYTQDTVWERGMPMRPPKYFDRRMEIEDSNKYNSVKQKRQTNAKKQRDKIRDEVLNKNYTNAAKLNHRGRIAVEITCKEAQFSQLKRGYENGK